MFDELDKQNIIPPAPFIKGGAAPAAPIAPDKTEDIFSEVDKTVKPEVLKPRDSNSPPISTTVVPSDNHWLKNKTLVFSLMFGGLIIIIGGGYLSLRLIVNNMASDDAGIKSAVDNNQFAPEVTAPTIEANNNIFNQPIKPTITSSVDSDQDGLTDEEEISLGMDFNNPDTDGDGLTDREEVKVYGTDPLNVDTDGDGYSDGEEVKNGFNPKGSGELLDINNPIQ